MPAAGTCRFRLLTDRGWLTDQIGAGRSAAAIATEIGCSETTVRRVLRSAGLETKRQAVRDIVAPEPLRRFVRFDPGELADLDADVAADELARRLAEGLTDLAEAGAAGWGASPRTALDAGGRGGRRSYSAVVRVCRGRCGS
jgi:hypothetical protein